ncbi:MAG: YolD-like family protein [Clostridia bacterium]|nr:YolD-like family protein [Clostridia bacterium]
MTRQQRAKQFMPFDAMKGLKEALAEREERHSRVEKRELSEDTIEYLSTMLSRLEIGMEATIEHYRACHDVVSEGRIKAVDLVYKYLLLDAEKIYFDNIYDIKLRET